MGAVVENERNDLIAKTSWAIAGTPIAVSLAQALIFIIGPGFSRLPFYELGDNLYNSFTDPLYNVAVFSLARESFWNQSGVTITLFIMIAICWAIVGLTLSRKRDIFGTQVDTVQAGAGGFAGLLYFLLFFGIYGGLLTGSVPIFQQVFFFAIPVVVTGCLLGAVYWSPNAEAGADLATAKETAKTKQRDFTDQCHTNIGEVVDTLAGDWIYYSKLPPRYETTVKNVHSELEEFDEECSEILSECERLEQEGNIDKNVAKSLRKRAESLEPNKVVSEQAEDLRRAIASVLETKYASFNHTSRYGDTYELVNHRHSMYLPHEVGDSLSGGNEININRIHPRLTSAIENGTLSARQSLIALEALEEEFYGDDGIITTVEEHEQKVANCLDTAEENLETATENIEAEFSQRVTKELRSLFIKENVDSVVGKPHIRTTIRDAQTELKECGFEQALKLAEQAERKSEELREAIDAFYLIEGHVIDQKAVFDIPKITAFEAEFYNEDSLSRIADAIQSAHGVRLDIDLASGKVELTTNGGSQVSSNITSLQDEETSSDEDLSISDAKQILNELEDQVKTGAATTEKVVLNFDSVPDIFVNQESMNALIQFCQTEYRDTVQVSEEEQYIRVEPPTHQTLSAHVSEIRQQFDEWADNHKQQQ